MLRIIIEGEELYDEKENLFVEPINDVIVDLEHSLISLSKWESKYQKPFLSSSEKTDKEIVDYLEAMVITPNLDPDVFKRCSSDQIVQIQEYIDSSQSATTFGMMPEHQGPGEVITSELIYYWMVAFNIPFECQNWHLNRLFALIRICNIKNSKPRQMSRHEMAQRHHDLNRQRREALGTSG